MNKELIEVLNKAKLSDHSSIGFYRNYFEISIPINNACWEEYQFFNPPSEECYDLALKTGLSTENINYIKRLQKEDNDELSLQAVKQSGWNLEHVKNQNPQICLEALNQDPTCLHLVTIVEFSSLDDCIQKLNSKIKLDRLITSG